MNNNPSADGGFRTGSLPDYAPLAGAYVPMQQSAQPNYEAGKALSRGTMFPGLDLPFMNLVNQEMEQTPMSEMMAIDFVADELELYLDTHREDREAFELYQCILKLQKEARERMIRLCGPMMQTDQLGMERYAWLDAPWPWELSEKREG